MKNVDQIALESARLFTTAERKALYSVMESRRDVRDEFLPRPVADDALNRILSAANMAPSVGLSQPWNFILIQDLQRRSAVHSLFEKANEEAKRKFSDERRSLYKSLKLQGVLKAPLNICVTCDRSRGGEVVLGKTHNPSMDIYSTVCAVQNLWLAARAEGIGVGWLSIFRDEDMRALLNIPDRVEIVAYLSVGYVDKFYCRPELEVKGWSRRRDVSSFIKHETWLGKAPEVKENLSSTSHND
jgi:5,6-dimethylbenzimidazole synthase